MADSAAADLARAEGLVDQALAALPRYAFAHFAKGNVLRAQNRWDEAIPEYEAALALNHNLVHALLSLGWCKLSIGSIEEVIPLVEQPIRVSPRDPGIGSFLPPDWNRASAAIPHRRGDRLARKNAQRHACRTDPSQPSRRRLCPQR
jgi:tetratricopeptide (TPR) repeat protein